MNKSIACLGSSKGQPGDVMYDAMQEVGKLIAMRGAIVMTGGFGGIGMEAPARGSNLVGGRSVGYTMWELGLNTFHTEGVNCDELYDADQDVLLNEFVSPPDCLEIQFGVRLGHLMRADGFVVAAGGGPGTLLELLTIINLNLKLWKDKPKKVAILCGRDLHHTSGWDISMLETIDSWCGWTDLDFSTFVVSLTPNLAVNWVLGEE